MTQDIIVTTVPILLDFMIVLVVVQQGLRQEKEWYILGNVKLEEAVVPEPCKCKKFISKQQGIPHIMIANILQVFFWIGIYLDLYQ
ncbi:hypothetical protein BH18THE2_BH18THE2_42000 [soil metagenome]